MGTELHIDRDSETANLKLVRALRIARVGTVQQLGDAGYAKAMGRLFSTEASINRPACIVQPANCEQVIAAVNVAREFGCPITVRGGSHSSLCAANQAILIDMSAQFGQVEVAGNEAKIGGGATMGSVLSALGVQSRLLPVGVARTPGMGLALQGGIGYLTRSLGLTLDSICSVEIVTPTGELLTLSDCSSGDHAQLWWAVRGCGPNFGVVTSMTVRTFAAPMQVFAKRLLLSIEALTTYFELAQNLPRNISASAVIGPPAAGLGEPVLFLYIVAAGCEQLAITSIETLAKELIDRSGTNALLEDGQKFCYHSMPPMDVPALTGFPMGPLTEVPATAPRVFAFKKSPFVKSLDRNAATGLIETIRSAPTQLCRIDFQQCGGALADVSPRDTAFWNRDFEWSCPIIGGYTNIDQDRDACIDWVRRTASIFASYTLGTYSVEVIPGLPETESELKLAFGENLSRLRELKRKWDPENLFRLYYPI